MKQRSFWIALLAEFLWIVPTLGFAAELRIGVLVSRGTHQVAREWKSTLVNQIDRQPLNQFGLLFVAESDSSIETPADFKGKSVACASRNAFAGWLSGVRLLLGNGIDPESNFKAIREVETHDNVIWAFFNGAADVGTVRTGTLEKMVLEGKLETSDFKIIRRITDDFPLMHSTQLYPENPMAACEHV